MQLCVCVGLSGKGRAVVLLVDGMQTLIDGEKAENNDALKNEQKEGIAVHGLWCMHCVCRLSLVLCDRRIQEPLP